LINIRSFFLKKTQAETLLVSYSYIIFMKAVDVIDKKGIFKPTTGVNIPEGAKYTVFLEDFVLLDAVSDKAKRIVGEVSKEEIAKLLP
jgi:predicted DNA-binding antitoxin AbrB/MazE fold protein